ncbi:MAG: signal peptidase II [Spirochaetes bacterium]|nr:signal peptidase II [Spirochaetota bacterium]
MKVMMKKHILVGVIAFTALVVDIFTKVLVEKHIMMGERIDVIGSFVQFTRIYNEGGVFGILQGYKNFFLIVSFAVLAALIVFYYFEKNKTKIFVVAMGLIFGGACGNISDRLLGKKGVVDFVYVGFKNTRWPAFNVADSCIVVGAILLMIVFFIQERKKRSAE